MEEYEYSYKVSNLKPYITYCEENGYRKEPAVLQNRKVYDNEKLSNVIARLTTTVVNERRKTTFDFKNITSREENLNISLESLSIKVDDTNRKFINSMLDTLEFKLCADNKRTRYVYKKNNVTFEIDDYSKPKMYVIAIEGDRKEVEKVNKELENINKLYQV